MRITFSIAALFMLTATACEVDEPCDPGYSLDKGLCEKSPTVGTDAASANTCIDKPSPDAGISDSGAAPAPGEFGRPCTDDVTHSECAEPAPLCFKQSASMPGFCSAINCDLYCNICPATWSCFNLGLVQPGAPHGCVKF